MNTLSILINALAREIEKQQLNYLKGWARRIRLACLRGEARPAFVFDEYKRIRKIAWETLNPMFISELELELWMPAYIEPGIPFYRAYYV